MGGGGVIYDQSNEHENPHFNNEYNTHMNSKNHEESGYGLDLDLVTILDYSYFPKS